jgi:hypothetical protein
MRAAITLTLVALVTFAVAFITRHVFFANVMPVSWDQEAVSTGALVMAYALLSIENVAAIVAALALVADLVLWSRRLMTAPAWPSSNVRKTSLSAAGFTL